jgi:hypothetical protein
VIAALSATDEQGRSLGAQYTEGEARVLGTKARDADDAKRLAALQERVRRKAAPRIREENIRLAQGILGGIVDGKTRQERDESMTRLRGLAQARPEAFGPGIPSEIEALSPERLAADAAESDAAEEAQNLADAAWRKTKAAGIKHRKEEAARKKQDADDFDQAHQMKLRKDAHDLAEAKRRAEHDRLMFERQEGQPTGQELSFVRQTARQMGQDPTNEQVHEMARAAINMNAQGVDAVNATVIAIQQKINQMDRAAAQWAQLKAQVGRRMGSDQTGQVSLTPSYIQ